MKRIVLVTALSLCSGALLCAAVLAAEKQVTAGEALFKKHCAVCHPDGGNVINPNKTLKGKSLEANNVKTEKDIIAKMRNPGPGMARFDEKTVPEAEARQIAEYVLKTFK